jgi:hypothetical protein
MTPSIQIKNLSMSIVSFILNSKQKILTYSPTDFENKKSAKDSEDTRMNNVSIEQKLR